MLEIAVCVCARARVCFKYLFESERASACAPVGWGGAEGEEDRESQADSTVSHRAVSQDSKITTVRS